MGDSISGAANAASRNTAAQTGTDTRLTNKEMTDEGVKTSAETQQNSMELGSVKATEKLAQSLFS